MIVAPNPRETHRDHITLRCYEADQGCIIGSWVEENIAPYRAWCEDRINEWTERVEALGYTMPVYCVGNVATGTQTYHEWLKERCGVR